MFERIIGPIYFLESRGFDSNIIYIDGEDQKVLIDTGTGMHMEHLDMELKRIGSSLDEITDVVLTHSHIDHIGGVPRIIELNDSKVYLHKTEADKINAGDMSLTLASTFGARLPPIKIENLLKEGDILKFGDLQFRVYHTPGHSIGSICLYEKEKNLLITGDTMFPGGSFGRVDFPTGDAKALISSLKKIAGLDFEIALAGHMSAILHNAKGSAQMSYEIARNMFNGWR